LYDTFTERLLPLPRNGTRLSDEYVASAAHFSWQSKSQFSTEVIRHENPIRPDCITLLAGRNRCFYISGLRDG
jgi:hypothetical protein